MRKQTFLTIAQFAEKSGLHDQTIRKWIRSGRIKGIARAPGGSILIPESNLSLTKMKSGRPKLKSSVLTRDDAAREYDKVALWGPIRRIPFSYEELEELFNEGQPFKTIGEICGVSRQRIHQIYTKYFAPFSGAGRERGKERTEKRRAEKVRELAGEVEKLSLLKRIVEKVGFEMEPLRTLRPNVSCHKNTVKINGRLCRVYHSKLIHQGEFYRSYYRINASKNELSKVEFVVVMVGEKVERVFVAPVKVMLDTYSPKSKKTWKTFYFPNKHFPPYNNQEPRINWWSFENAWSQLDG